jgi:hypothetical protein
LLRFASVIVGFLKHCSKHALYSAGAVGAEAAAGYSADYYSQYSQYWTQVAAWQQYQQYYQAGYTQVRKSQLLHSQNRGV